MTKDIEELLSFIENEKQVYVKNAQTPGSSIDAWDTGTGPTLQPPAEWSSDILPDAVKTAVLPSLIKRRYDSMRRVLVPISLVQTTTWSSTVAEDLSTTNVQKYEASAKSLDPVEYRTVLYIARKSLDEATWQLENDIRYRLTNSTALKLDLEAWKCLDDSWSDGVSFDVHGDVLANTTSGNAVAYAPVLNPDMVVDSIYAIKATSYGFYSPNQAIVTPAMTRDLMKNSVFINSAEWGNDSVVKTGVFSTFLGLNWHVNSNIPQCIGDKDLGAIFDDNMAWIANIPQFLEIDAWRRYWTDEIGFYTKCKAAFSVGDPDALSILYYST